MDFSEFINKWQQKQNKENEVPQSVKELLNLSKQIQQKNGTYKYSLWEMMRDTKEARDRFFRDGHL